MLRKFTHENWAGQFWVIFANSEPKSRAVQENTKSSFSVVFTLPLIKCTADKTPFLLFGIKLILRLVFLGGQTPIKVMKSSLYPLILSQNVPLSISPVPSFVYTPPPDSKRYPESQVEQHIPNQLLINFYAFRLRFCDNISPGNKFARHVHLLNIPVIPCSKRNT